MLTTLRRGTTSLLAIPYYLLGCTIIEPRRTAAFLRSIYAFYQSESLYSRSRSCIPPFNATELFPGIFNTPVCLRDVGPSGGSPTSFEIYVLASLVGYALPRSIFEFGTFEGRTTLQFAINSPDEALIYTIDLPANNVVTRYPRAYASESRARRLPVGGCFHGQPESRKITQLTGDSATHNLDEFRERVEFCFVDGDHSFEYVKADSENAFRMLAPGGLILWHDYSGSWPSVSQYLRELARTKSLYHIAETSIVVYGPTLQPRTQYENDGP